MCTKNRIRLVVLFLIEGALLAILPTQAGNGYGSNKVNYKQCQLTPTGIEPDASGQARLSNIKLWPTEWRVYGTGTLSVTCQGLTPNATYSTPVGTCTTNGSGHLKARGTCEFSWQWDYPILSVTVSNANGETVLAGHMGW